MDEERVEHPLDRQNAIEREIQLRGSKDPDNFEMPDGKTLTEVRKSLQERHDQEYREETAMIGKTTREASLPEFKKGKDLAVTPTGVIIDVTEPPKVERTTPEPLPEIPVRTADSLTSETAPLTPNESFRRTDSMVDNG